MTLLIDASCRQAALLLHSLTDADRQWVLSALPVHQQTALRSLLEELHDLGIPDDKQLMATLLLKVPQIDIPNSSVPASTPALSGEAIDLMQLKPKEIQTLARLLNRESAEFVANVLHIYKWPWEQALLPLLTPSQEQHVRAKLHVLKRETVHVFASAVPLALEKALRQVLTTAIQESRQHEENINTSSPSLWQRWQTISTRLRIFARNRIAMNEGRPG